MKTKKYWIFRILLKHGFAEFFCGDIYAWTTSKRKAKQFKAARHENNFIMEKCELTQEEEKTLLKNNFNNELIRKTIATRYGDGVIYVPVILTKRECQMCEIIKEHCLYVELSKCGWVDISILKKDYRDALKLLHYDKLHSYIEDPGSVDISKYFIVDELRILIDLYGPLFLKGWDG